VSGHNSGQLSYFKGFYTKYQYGLNGLPILGGIWLLGAVLDRLWFALDHSVPSWDPADYLTGSLVYWNALQTPQWFSGDWWTSLWQLSSKIPPLVYISTAPLINLLGAGEGQITTVFLLFSAILLASVYGLGLYLFNRQVGLWAAALCVLMPTLYETRLVFILDYPLTAMILLCFTVLTLWRGTTDLIKNSKLKIQNSDPTSPASPLPLSPLPDTDSSLPPPIHPSPPPSSEPSPSSSTPPSPLPDKEAKPKQGLLPLPFTLPPLPPLSLPLLYPWLLAALFGITLGLALMTKQTAALFLLVPILWVIGERIWQRNWISLLQLGFGLVVSLFVFLPWYRTNWLLILTSSKRATIDSAILEGAPPLWSLKAWTLYLRELPGMVSWPLLLVPLLGLLLFWQRSQLIRRRQDIPDDGTTYQDLRQESAIACRKALIWLLVFVVGGYVMSSLNPNKDTRYVAPYLPVLALILAYGLVLFPRSWRLVRWSTVALAGLLMLVNLFPIFSGSRSSNALTSSFHPYTGQAFPHAQVVAEVATGMPFLRSTIGVIPSTPEVNQHNLNYFGLLHNFQVFGRQVGARKSFVKQDLRSLNWFVTKTESQGSIRNQQAQVAMVQGVEQNKAFQLQKTWPLPDKSTLKLYRRKVPAVEVGLSPKPSTGQAPVRLDQVQVPAQAPAGKPIPVTYRWSGPWDNLQNGLVLLTWKQPGQTNDSSQNRWFHDHGIGLGQLFPDLAESARPDSSIQVTERTAMLPPAEVTPGTYQLQALYLDRRTQQATPLTIPTVTVRIDPAAKPSAAPELDLVTQLKTLAETLPQGTASLSRISDEVSRVNQYDAVQDYLVQAQQAMRYRLQQEPQNPNFAYTLALATVLKRQVNPAIAALEQVTQVDASNPYAYAYLAFVNLFDFRPGAAQSALNQALKLNPNLPEVQALSGIASLMQGNLWQAWQHAQTYLAQGGVQN
jgi:4-amino-4-deoxy-L-arabinose transferase-like glycosyltransferase